MKKGLLLYLALGIGMSSMAQMAQRLPEGFRPAQAPARVKNLAVPFTRKSAQETNVIPVNNVQSRRLAASHPAGQNQVSTTIVGEEIIGYSYYDLQTNGTISDRLVKNSDGTFSAVWTFSPDADQTPVIFPRRGTGYNYYDGTTDWYFTPPQSCTPGGVGGDFPQLKIEPLANRTGFTNICVTASGKEMTIQHTGTEMCMNWRPTKGTGAWTYSTPWGTANTDFWPKAIGGGGTNGETVHAIWQGSGSGTGSAVVHGQFGPLFYSRSTDGGQTWGINKQIIADIDSSHYFGFGPDCYRIDCKGDVVAIVYGDGSTDVGLLKSTDNGNTWTKTIVNTFPIPFFDPATMISDVNSDGIADTILSSGGDPFVLIDNNGMCHVWFSLMRYLCTTPGTGTGQGLSYFPGTDGLVYWNETMLTDSAQLIAQTQDFNGNDSIDLPNSTACDWNWGLYGGAGLTSSPSAGIDAAGNIYLTYQAINESADTNLHQAHRHVYMTKTTDNGANWSFPFNIVPDINTVLCPGITGDANYQEAVFACIARKVDNYAYVLYQRDPFPGTALATSGCDQANNLGNPSDQVLGRIESATVGIHNPVAKSTAQLAVINYPNPAKDYTDLKISLVKPADMVITVTDVMGKTVHTETVKSSSSADRIIRLNTSGWNSGVYFYSVTANGQKASNALVIQ